MRRKISRNFLLGAGVSLITLLTLSFIFSVLVSPALAQTAIADEKQAFASAQPAVTQKPPVGFAKAVTYPSGGDWVWSVSVADLNGDGKLDLIVANLCQATWSCYSTEFGAGQIGVLLGNGDGTFQSAVGYSSGGYNAWSVAVGDLNGDGHPDVVVANVCQSSDCASASVSVLMGNGDGTFQPAVSYAWSGYSAVSLAIADLNGDSHPDLIVGSGCPSGGCVHGAVGVLMGNGDGTFQTPVTYDSGGSYAMVAVGDLNADGKPDIVVANSTGTVGVLLNNGNGTLQPAVNYGSGGYAPASVAIADVNADGKPDLLVANCGSSGVCGNGMVGVLLGNGNGTFQAPIGYNAGGTAQSIAVADVNGDGHPDLVVANLNGVGVLPGNGDGTFQSPVGYSAGGSADAIAVADINSDGKPDLVVGNWTGSVSVLLNDFTAKTTTSVTSSLNPSFVRQPVTFTATIASNSVVPDGQVVTFLDGTAAIGTGTTKGGIASFTTSSLPAKTHTIRASYSGDLYHNASGGHVTQVVSRYATTAGLTSSANPSAYTQAVTFTATVISAGVAPTGKVRFMDGTKTLGAAAVSGGVATLVTSKLALGTHPITAEYLGDADTATSTSAVLNQVVD